MNENSVLVSLNIWFDFKPEEKDLRASLRFSSKTINFNEGLRCVSMEVTQDIALSFHLFAKYRVIHEECHSFRELICHVMLMEKVHMNKGPIFNSFGEHNVGPVSSEMVWNLVNRAQLTNILREVSEPWSADIGESPF